MKKEKSVKSLTTSASHDWFGMRRDYIHGFQTEGQASPTWPTMKELGIKYGLPVNKVTDRAAMEKWTASRAAFVQKLESQISNKRIKNAADQSANFDSTCYNVAETGVKEMEDQMSFFQDLIDADGNRKFMNIEFYEKIAKTVEKFQRIGRIALGLSPNNDSASHNVQNIKIVSFSEGLDKVMQQIKSNPDLHEKLQDEIID